MLSKNYEAEKAEKKWQNYWEKNKIYKFDPKSKKKVYSLDVPPPYASAGHLHIGHALHYTQFEIIARYKRMKNFNVYFAPCFDNNGLPTEKYVEEKFNISKERTTKEEFRKLCREESKKIEKEYANKVFRKLGHSYDWSLLYTTIDKEAQEVAQTSFIDLIEKGDCYRSKEPVLWCPKHQTALAQAEIEDMQRNSILYYIDFNLEKNKKVSIATTRPELLPACVAVFVHPKDKRYKHLIGKKVTVPLFNHKVSIMQDETVDPKFGTGIMMVCTFGDRADVEKWKKYKLPLRVCITKKGKLKSAKKYSGLTLEQAKNQIIMDLKEKITKQEKIKQTVGTCWRCNTPIEFIVTEQWFIKTLKYKNQLIQQGKKVNWYPGFYRKRFEDWTKNIGWDWCISRQRFYGVPIPVWYCKKCRNIILPKKSQLPLDPEKTKPKRKCKCGSNEFEPEHDVFDTWMTSSMSPQIAARWLKKPKQFKKIFPLSLRPQSHDIIRTWAFYTILKSYLHFKKIPWKDIVIGTYILDPKGKGMSKSKGNVIWADDLLRKYNVDNFRYWVATARLGEDLLFNEKDLITGKKFIIKLWNASKFSLFHLKNFKLEKPKKLEATDKWLLSKLNFLIKQTTNAYDNYNISLAKKLIEQFFKHTFCDHYLEIIKDRLYNPKKRGLNAKKSAQFTLFTSLLTILKLIAPIMPHITEEIYQSYFKKLEKAKSIHISQFPKPNQKLINKDIERLANEFIKIIAKIRQFKSKHKRSLKTPIKLTIPSKLKPFLLDLKAVTNAKEIKFGKFKVSF